MLVKGSPVKALKPSPLDPWQGKLGQLDRDCLWDVYEASEGLYEQMGVSIRALISPNSRVPTTRPLTKRTTSLGSQLFGDLGPGQGGLGQPKRCC